MMFQYVKPHTLKHGDLIAVYANDLSANILLVQEVNETEEIDGYPALEVRGIYISPPRAETGDRCAPVEGKNAISVKVRMRSFPNILLLREGMTHEETED
jgi:hypothetical protein